MDKNSKNKRATIVPKAINIENNNSNASNSASNNAGSNNTEDLTSKMFFDEEEMKIMKSYFKVEELELKLLEHLENYRKKKNIDRKVSGNEFYNNNLSELELFSKLNINTEQERNNILYRGEILIFRFYPGIENEFRKDSIIRNFHVSVRSAFAR